MARRHRHFNPVHAGAVMAADARYLTGLSNGGSVTTFTGRAGSTHSPTQGTADNRPEYRTSGINQVPAILFDDTVDGKFFTSSITFTSNQLTHVAVAQKTINRSTTTFARISSIWNTGDIPGTTGDYGNNNGMIFGMMANASFGGFDPSLAMFRNNTTVAAHSYTLNAIGVVASRLSGTNGLLKYNGASATGTTGSTALNSDQYRIGAAPAFSIALPADSNFGGYIGSASLFASALSDSLLKRIEHAAAYSYKIPCA